MSTYNEDYIIPRTGQRPLRFKGAVIASHRFNGGAQGLVWMRILRNRRRQFVCAVSRMAVAEDQRDFEEAVIAPGIVEAVNFFGASRPALALYRDARWHGVADFIEGLPSIEHEEVVKHVELWLRPDTAEAA